MELTFPASGTTYHLCDEENGFGYWKAAFVALRTAELLSQTRPEGVQPVVIDADDDSDEELEDGSDDETTAAARAGRGRRGGRDPIPPSGEESDADEDQLYTADGARACLASPPGGGGRSRGKGSEGGCWQCCGK